MIYRPSSDDSGGALTVKLNATERKLADWPCCDVAKARGLKYV